MNHPVTFEELCQLFRQSGAEGTLGLFERMVDEMYGVEAYVQCNSRREVARVRDALDGQAIYAGCCFLTVDLIPPIYTTITTPADDDELTRAYFYDDTPYEEWAAALAVAECRYEVAASRNVLLTTAESHGVESTALDSCITSEVLAMEQTFERKGVHEDDSATTAAPCEDIALIGKLRAGANTDQFWGVLVSRRSLCPICSSSVVALRSLSLSLAAVRN